MNLGKKQMKSGKVIRVFMMLVIQVAVTVVLVGPKKIKEQEGWIKMMLKKCISRWV